MIRRLATVLPFTTALALAQIPPGNAVVAWKASGPAPGGLTMFDAQGSSVGMPGLAPATIGTGQFDGASAVLVADDGTVFAGLGVDNRTGSAPVGLGMRHITWNGSTATDMPFVTLLQVPVGEIWEVADIRERFDGSLLVAATQVVLGSNPVGTPAVLIVNRTGTSVQTIPTTGMASGILRAIADFGDRYAVAVEQSFFARNFALQSLAFDGLSAPFTIRTLVSVGSFGGFERDLNGELVFGATFSLSAGATVHRIAHAPNSTPIGVVGTPPSIGLGDVNPASGVLSSFGFPGAGGSTLSRTDTVLGGVQPWTIMTVGNPISLSVRDNPSAYGLTPPHLPLPMLGTQGGVPAVGNTGFALRLHDWGQSSFGIVAAGFGRAVIATQFGTLLVQPGTLITIGSVAVPPGPSGVLALSIPNNANLRGLRFHLQDLVVRSSPFSAALSNALDLTVQ